MYTIVDRRIPEPALKKLAKAGTPIPFFSEDITYPSISGHPDVFLCKTPKGLIAAPNTPAEVLHRLANLGIAITMGELYTGKVYPQSARYNAFVNTSFFIHNTRHSDPVLKQLCESLTSLHVKQAYTRCNLMEAGQLFITSDKGIEKVLTQQKLDVFFIDPRDIILPGHNHGFFGGCTGIHDHTMYLIGSCNHFKQGNELKSKLTSRGIDLVELYDGPLWDGGSIICI